MRTRSKREGMAHAGNALFYCTQLLCCLWLCDQLTQPRVLRETVIVREADAPLPLVGVRE